MSRSKTNWIEGDVSVSWSCKFSEKMSNVKLILSIIKYLKDEAQKENLNADTKESLEVAVQCLQTAYELDPSDPLLAHLLTDQSLADIFSAAVGGTEVKVEKVQASDEAIEEAEKMKNLGNTLMKSEKFEEAIKSYSDAILLDGNNAIYYGNRAAAYSKLGDFKNAIKDCQEAIAIDPKYGKAYGRMGLAYASLEQHDQAIQCFKKALEIDPTNESYQSNLKIAEDKVRTRLCTPTPGPGMPGFSNVDWHSLFSNPAFRNMASTLMQDPNIINALSASMSSSLNQGGGGGGGGGRNLDFVLEAGQYLAAQMQAANPDLVEQFRQTASRTTNPPNPDTPDSSTK